MEGLPRGAESARPIHRTAGKVASNVSSVTGRAGQSRAMFVQIGSRQRAGSGQLLLVLDLLPRGVLEERRRVLEETGHLVQNALLDPVDIRRTASRAFLPLPVLVE